MLTNFILKIAILYKRKVFKSWHTNADSLQESTLLEILKSNKSTVIGQKYNFGNIKSYDEYKKVIPVHFYSDYESYVEEEFESSNVLVSGTYKYIAFNSQTTDAKLKKTLPYNKKMIKANLKFGLLSIVHCSDIYQKNYFKKVFYLTGNPELIKYKGKDAGMVSAIYKHDNPKFLESLSCPSQKTARIIDFKEKIKAMAKEVLNTDLSVMTGTPPWFIYVVKEMAKLKPLKGRYNNLDLIIYGGGSIGTYRNILDSIFEKPMNYFETYATTEGYLGFQYGQIKTDMILNVDGKIFYEFITLNDFENKNYINRLSLKDIKINVRYVTFITNVTGLYSYFLGDILEFTSTSPYLFKYSGRTKHFLQMKNTKYYEDDLTKSIYESILNKDVYFSEFCFSQVNEKIYFIVEIIDESKVEKLKEQLALIPNLLEMTLIIVKPESFYLYMQENHRVGGQYKISRIDPEGSVYNRLKKLIIE